MQSFITYRVAAPKHRRLRYTEMLRGERQTRFENGLQKKSQTRAAALYKRRLQEYTPWVLWNVLLVWQPYLRELRLQTRFELDQRRRRSRSEMSPCERTAPLLLQAQPEVRGQRLHVDKHRLRERGLGERVAPGRGTGLVAQELLG